MNRMQSTIDSIVLGEPLTHENVNNVGGVLFEHRRTLKSALNFYQIISLPFTIITV